MARADAVDDGLGRHFRRWVEHPLVEELGDGVRVLTVGGGTPTKQWERSMVASSIIARTGILWEIAKDLNRLRSISAARWPLVCNCGVKQSAPGWPPSNLTLCAQTRQRVSQWSLA